MTVTEDRLRDALSAAATIAADVRPLTAPARRRSRLPVALAAVATAAAVGTGFLWVRQAAPQATAAETALPPGDEQKIAVFLCQPVDPFPACRNRSPEKAAIAEALRSMPGVESVTFEDRREAYLNFRRQFEDDAKLLRAIAEKDLPESFRVLPRPDADRKEIVEAAKQLPGVSNVVDPRCLSPLVKIIFGGC